MRRRALALSTLILLAAGFAPAQVATEGTAQPRREASNGNYFVDRAHDFLDMFRLRVGLPQTGKGAGVKARVTSLAQVGYVHFRGKMIGPERRAIGITHERRTEGGLSVFYGSIYEMEPLRGNAFLRANSVWSDVEDRRILRNAPYWDDGRRRHLSIGAEVATPILGLDFGIYPEEIADFVVGIFTIDLFNDDESDLNEDGVYEASTAREPDPSAPFAAKRQALSDFDDEIAAREALADTPTSPTLGRQTAPGKTPVESTEDITEQQADEAMKKLDERTTTPAPTPTPTPAPTAAATPTPTSAPAPTPEIAQTPTPSPIPSPSPQPSPSPTLRPTRTPRPTPTEAPSPTVPPTMPPPTEVPRVEEPSATTPPPLVPERTPPPSPSPNPSPDPSQYETPGSAAPGSGPPVVPQP